MGAVAVPALAGLAASGLSGRQASTVRRLTVTPP